ncbi:hypothetical protein AAGW05_16255 [Arthrobacter sp. LAPM80]|uniref:hypothetical protein n=1 Tax=Arthrobacter sp. LAPM80 TaxID=3141788 RepID=UPI00398AF079
MFVKGRAGLATAMLVAVITGHQRRKLESYGDVLFLVVRFARYDDAREEDELA